MLCDLITNYKIKTFFETKCFKGNNEISFVGKLFSSILQYLALVSAGLGLNLSMRNWKAVVLEASVTKRRLEEGNMVAAAGTLAG